MIKSHEGRFEGADNAGLRSQIRDQVRAWQDGRVNTATAGEAILVLADSVALTAQGRATLASVAADYDRTARTKRREVTP